MSPWYREAEASISCHLYTVLETQDLPASSRFPTDRGFTAHRADSAKHMCLNSSVGGQPGPFPQGVLGQPRLRQALTQLSAYNVSHMRGQSVDCCQLTKAKTGFMRERRRVGEAADHLGTVNLVFTFWGGGELDQLAAGLGISVLEWLSRGIKEHNGVVRNFPQQDACQGHLTGTSALARPGLHLPPQNSSARGCCGVK